MQRLILLLICLQFGWVTAQKASKKKADELFENRTYIEAAQMYKQLKPNQEILQNLADCYYYNNNMLDAKAIYQQLYSNYKNQLDKEYLFRYAQTLMAINDYKTADKIFKEYYGYEVDTKKFMENLKAGAHYQYQIERVSINAESGDFGVTYWGNKVVFAASNNPERPKYHWNNQAYLDLYMADLDKDGKLINVQPFSDQINTDTHESSAIFTKDRKTMYFNRTNDKRVKVGKETFASVKLYRAEFIDSTWTNITELPFNDDSYSVQNPALSPDEKRLYFASDMPGTLGGLDLFYVDILEDGSYGSPVNLGPKINTIHREQFPYLCDQNHLYFSSDGHQGFGGLDIFYSELDENNAFKEAINLGENINSGYDDFSFIINHRNHSGYFSSNRKEIDQIYSFTRVHVSDKYTVEGIVLDKHTSELLPGTTISLYDEKQHLLAQVVVGENGKYILPTQPNTKYRIEATKDLYIPYNEEVVTNAEGRVVKNIELYLESYADAEDLIVRGKDGLTYIQLENIYYDFDKWNIRKDSKETLDILVGLLKKYPRLEVQLRAHTDNRATQIYNLALSNKRAKSAVDYIIAKGITKSRLTFKGYGEDSPLIDCKDQCSELEHAINRRCEFIITK